MKRSHLALSLLTLSACEPKTKDAPKANPDPASTSSVAPKPSASATSNAALLAPSASAALPEPPAPQACKVMEQKVWGKGVNPLTGLTVHELDDGRIAVGFAFGNSPKALIVDRKGESALVNLVAKSDIGLANHPKPADGAREIMRVTPYSVTANGAEAFVDYRDIYKDGRRRVVCGGLDREWLAFDGKSLVGKDHKAKAKPDVALYKDNKARELRDCRTIIEGSKGANAWVVGSVLSSTLGTDGLATYKSELVATTAGGKNEHTLNAFELKVPATGDVPIVGYEVPVADKLENEHLLAVRRGSSLLVGLLDFEMKLKGSFKSYEGYASLVDIGTDGGDIVLTTTIPKGKNATALRSMRVEHANPELPAGMRELVLDEDPDEAESDAEFVRSPKGQRWYSFIDGQRGAGTLHIVPVNAKLNPMGKAYPVNEGDERAREGRLVALNDGGLVVVYSRLTKSGGEELVTEDLDCEVMK